MYRRSTVFSFLFYLSTFFTTWQRCRAVRCVTRPLLTWLSANTSASGRIVSAAPLFFSRNGSPRVLSRVCTRLSLSPYGIFIFSVSRAPLSFPSAYTFIILSFVFFLYICERFPQTCISAPKRIRDFLRCTSTIFVSFPCFPNRLTDTAAFYRTTTLTVRWISHRLSENLYAARSSHASFIIHSNTHSLDLFHVRDNKSLLRACCVFGVGENILFYLYTKSQVPLARTRSCFCKTVMHEECFYMQNNFLF